MNASLRPRPRGDIAVQTRDRVGFAGLAPQRLFGRCSCPFDDAFVETLTNGEVKDVERKRSPYLVPWSELSEDVKDQDRNFVRELPGLVMEAGFRVKRLGARTLEAGVTAG